MNQKQLLEQIKYLRATIAPNIRQKRKTTEGKFVLLSIEEMKNEIRTTLKPENDLEDDLETILNPIIKARGMSENLEHIEANEYNDNGLKHGSIGVFENEFEEKSVCLLLDSETLQPFVKTRRGYAPSLLTIPLEGWSVTSLIEDYSYVTCRGAVYLHF